VCVCVCVCVCVYIYIYIYSNQHGVVFQTKEINFLLVWTCLNMENFIFA